MNSENYFAVGGNGGIGGGGGGGGGGSPAKSDVKHTFVLIATFILWLLLFKLWAYIPALKQTIAVVKNIFFILFEF